MRCSLATPRWASRKPRASSSFSPTNGKEKLFPLHGGLHDSQCCLHGAFSAADPFFAASIGYGTRRSTGSSGGWAALPCVSLRGLETLDARLPGDGDWRGFPWTKSTVDRRIAGWL